MLQTVVTRDWNAAFSEEDSLNKIQSLENNKILFFPHLRFQLFPEEYQFLNDFYADPHSKNISYDVKHKRLWGVKHLSDKQHVDLKNMMHRYAKKTHQLLECAFKAYATHIKFGRTSFRVVEVHGRKISFRKDDRLLHIDSFPSAPCHGKRLLRIFTNINPTQPRIWQVGEIFSLIVDRYQKALKKPTNGSRALLRLLKITKSYRSLYDHYMLQIHNLMKIDRHFQTHSNREEIEFPSGSTWMTFGDDLAHAATQGQFVLEQTFYLDIEGMKAKERAPLVMLQNIFGHKLT